MATKQPDPYDLNQDRRVTKDEIDRAAGASPGYFAKKPEGSGFLGGAMNLAGNAIRSLPLPMNIVYGANDRQARKDDWETRRNSLYTKYGINQGVPKAAPGGAVNPMSKAGGLLKSQGGGMPGGMTGSPQDALQGTFRDARYKPKNTGFDTLGVNQGLIDMGIVREQMDAAGNLVYVTPRKGGESVVMQYKAQDAFTLMAEWDDEQLGNFRRAMYISGYGDPRTYAGPLTLQDVDLMTEAMTDANMSGLGWDEVVNRKVEAGGRYARPLTMYEGAIQSGDITSVLKQFGQRNGIVLSDSFIANQSRAVAEGQIDTEDLLNLVKETYVKTLYPAFEKEIDAGLTIEDLAGPWRSYLAETFGVDEKQISLFDPLLQAALQNFGPDGKPSKTAMNQFAEMVHEDPRWEYSPDAWNKIGLAQDTLAAEFGAANKYGAPTRAYGPQIGGGGYRG